MPTELSSLDANRFVVDHSDDLVTGGPIPSSNSRTIATLGDYLLARFPPYGVIVRVGADDYLVWYDASSRLHVIDVTGEPIAGQVPRAPYESPDSGLIAALMDSLRRLTSYVPTPATLFLLAAAVGLAVISSKRKG